MMADLGCEQTNRLPQDALLALAYLDELATFSKVCCLRLRCMLACLIACMQAGRRTLHNHVPPYVMDEFRKQVAS